MKNKIKEVRFFEVTDRDGDIWLQVFIDDEDIGGWFYYYEGICNSIFSGKNSIIRVTDPSDLTEVFP